MYLLKFIEDWTTFSKGKDKLNSADLHIHQLYHKYNSFKRHLSWPSDSSYPSGFLLPLLDCDGFFPSSVVWLLRFILGDTKLMTASLLLALLGMGTESIFGSCPFFRLSQGWPVKRPAFSSESCPSTPQVYPRSTFHSVRNLLPIKK